MERTLIRKCFKFPLMPIGVLAPGSAHAKPFAQPPIGMSGNFRRTHLQSHIQSFGTTFQFYFKTLKMPPGGQWSPNVFG